MPGCCSHDRRLLCRQRRHCGRHHHEVQDVHPHPPLPLSAQPPLPLPPWACAYPPLDPGLCLGRSHPWTLGPWTLWATLGPWPLLGKEPAVAQAPNLPPPLCNRSPTSSLKYTEAAPTTDSLLPATLLRYVDAASLYLLLAPRMWHCCDHPRLPLFPLPLILAGRSVTPSALRASVTAALATPPATRRRPSRDATSSSRATLPIQSAGRATAMLGLPAARVQIARRSETPR